MKHQRTAHTSTNAVYSVIATEDEMGGRFAIVAVTLPPHDAGTPMHRHTQHAEGCYVIDGTLALTQDAYTTTLTAGTSALVQPGVPHAYWNPTAAPTTMLLIVSPGATEAQVLALAIGSPVESDGATFNG